MDGELAAVISALGLIIAGLTAAVIKLWKASDESQAGVDRRIVAGYELAIAELKASTNARITALETAYASVLVHHEDCQRELAQVKAELNLVKTQLNTLTKGAGS